MRAIQTNSRNKESDFPGALFSHCCRCTEIFIIESFKDVFKVLSFNRSIVKTKKTHEPVSNKDYTLEERIRHVTGVVGNGFLSRKNLTTRRITVRRRDITS